MTSNENVCGASINVTDYKVEEQQNPDAVVVSVFVF